MPFSIYQIGAGGQASRGLEPLFWTRHHMTSGPRPSWECRLQLPAESWHQQALPGEMPGHRWGGAYAHGLGRAGPWPQHLQNPEAQAISPLPYWPGPPSGVLVPCLSSLIFNVVTS